MEIELWSQGSFALSSNNDSILVVLSNQAPWLLKTYGANNHSGRLIGLI